MDCPWSSTVDDFQLWRSDASGPFQHASAPSRSSAPFARHDSATGIGAQGSGTVNHFQSHQDARIWSRVGESSRAHTSDQTYNFAPRSSRISTNESSRHHQLTENMPLNDSPQYSSGPRSFGFDKDTLQERCSSKSIIVPYSNANAAGKAKKAETNGKTVRKPSSGSWRGKYRGGAKKSPSFRKQASSGAKSASSNNTRKGRGTNRRSEKPAMTPARVVCAKQAGSDQSMLLFEAVEDEDGIETISISRGDVVYKRLEDINDEDIRQTMTQAPSSFDDCAPKSLFLGDSSSTYLHTARDNARSDSTNEEERRVAKYGTLFQCNDGKYRNARATLCPAYNISLTEVEQERMQNQMEHFKSDVQEWSTLNAPQVSKTSSVSRLSKGQRLRSEVIPALGAASKHQDGKLGSIRLGAKSIPLLESSEPGRQASESSLTISFGSRKVPAAPAVRQWLQTASHGAHPTQSSFTHADSTDVILISDSSSQSEASWNDPSEVYAVGASDV